MELIDTLAWAYLVLIPLNALFFMYTGWDLPNEEPQGMDRQFFIIICIILGAAWIFFWAYFFIIEIHKDD